MKEKSSSRAFERFKPGTKCKAKLIYADEVTIKNISLGGILVETTKRLNVNNSYRIQIVSHNNKEAIAPIGVVVRSFLRGTVNEEYTTLPLYEVALKFSKLNDKEEDFLKKIFKKNTKIAENSR